MDNIMFLVAKKEKHKTNLLVIVTYNIYKQIYRLQICMFPKRTYVYNSELEDTINTYPEANWFYLNKA